MTLHTRFRCPACGFTVFNRRLATCESCHANLSVGLRFTAADLVRLAEDEARNTETRKELARQAEELERQRQKRRGDGG
ncbi:MAG: hypothetical protein WAW73_15225 [Rhodoferax sp.]